MTKSFTLFTGLTAVLALFAFTLVTPALATTPASTWDTTGTYTVAVMHQGTNYDHNLTMAQDSSGNLSGTGTSTAGGNVYTWMISSGSVTGDNIRFTALYTATPDAVTPQTTMNVIGTIATSGSMSGTWSDNYGGQSRTGTWTTKSGTATAQNNASSSDTVTVSVHKFINGTMATAMTGNNTDFPMTATWDATNMGAGSGSYTLSESSPVPYHTVTDPMTKGADYETRELLTGSSVGAQCADGKPFALRGYTTGNTKAEAMTATATTTAPSFTNLQRNKHVIVWNQDCDRTDGEIGGEVVAPNGVLEVTSIEMIDTTATANGTFTDGWKYVFHVTAPMNEPKLAMKFNDWLRTGGGGTIPVANNMRISSLQANNSGATILLLAANVYSTPNLIMTGDLNPTMAGRQVQIVVEVAVPTGTPTGAYTTSYGVRSNP